MRGQVVYVGFIGMGNVGTGTLKILQDNQGEIRQRTGVSIQVRRIAVAHPNKPRPEWVDRSLITGNVDEVLDDPEIDIVVECMGGLEPARTYIRRAMKAGKSIVTANKELLAKDGHSILEEAASAGVDFFFEAAVAGGIPIIRPLKTSLAANRIQQVVGIVNGTTNYILSKMADEGREFADVLAEAQRLGYAEPDPTDDIEGFDAAYKLAILASISFQNSVPIASVYHEGITKITKRDIDYARELGYAIKLLAIGKMTDGAIEVRVHPTLLPLSHPLASVNDVFNAIFVCGDAVGEVMFYGRGAGPLPTGSAVAGDIMDVARNIKAGATGQIKCTCGLDKPILPMEKVRTRYYVRMLVADRPGVLAAIAGVLGEHDVSIASMVQKEAHAGDAEIVWVTHEAVEQNMRTALDLISKLPVVRQISSVIRVESFSHED
ncbi:MAG: homoserine dehydrogenase [Armatimonadota bacterium]